MQALPIDAVIPEALEALRRARSIVVVAPPGAGKTTRLPPAIVRSNLLAPSHPNLVMLQPRRVAARAAAHRIADEQKWTLGDEVGYQVRFERKIGIRTRLRVITEGILTRQLLDDPSLADVGCVVLDEFHERSIHTDLSIAMLREVRRSLRENLLLVVMSATLHAGSVAEFLGNCPIIRAEGRTFPVEIMHRAPMGRRLHERTADAVREVLPESGDVLVFLPGAAEIRGTMRLLESEAGADVELLPLYGSLPFEQQLRALQPSARRKIIFATNIAETSLTIEGVRIVIDGGYARVAGFDPQRGLDRLELARISKASSEQRAGRAGRTGPGKCVRLWTIREQHELADFDTPEVKRVDLCATVLALHAWGEHDAAKFPWFEPPPADALHAAERLLEMIGALAVGRLTSLGQNLLALPVHPRIGRLLVAAVEAGRMEDGAAMAAILEEKDILAPAPDARGQDAQTQGPSDLLVRMELLLASDSRDHRLDRDAARQAARTRDQLLRIARAIPQPQRQKRARNDIQPLQWPLLAYPDRVVRRRPNDPGAGVMVGGGGVRLSPESVVRAGEFFVALDARHDERSPTREAFVRLASRIEVDWLEQFFPQSIRRERAIEFDESRQRVVEFARTFYRDLLIHEARDAPIDPIAAGDVLATQLRPRARQIVESDERAGGWIARARFLMSAIPELDWPALDDDFFAQVMADAARGKRSVAEIQPGTLLSHLQARIDYQVLRLIDAHAPESVEVPTGNRIRLDYGAGARPILAVRLQEIFGLIDTPRVAQGRVPVLLHILGPNYRPVQVTDDLKSFWKNTYPQVRKDLRVRYPKHSWPDDPLTAQPQAKGGRRR